MKKATKKQYQTPMMHVMKLKNSPTLLTGSGVYGKSDYNSLRYGGVDSEGEEDPD